MVEAYKRSYCALDPPPADGEGPRTWDEQSHTTTNMLERKRCDPYHFSFLSCYPRDLNIDGSRNWSPTFTLEYVRVVESCKTIIETVNPPIVVVDSVFNPACEACWSLNKRYITSSPTAPLDVARDCQPTWKRWFYYPL